MKFKNLTHEAVCELLLYLAEYEDFESIKRLNGLKKEMVREIFQEIAAQLRQEMNSETTARPDYSHLNLSSEALSIISSLSPREEMLLFKSFRLI